jgi:hypothetical protein
MFIALVNIEHLVNKKARPAGLVQAGMILSSRWSIKRCATGLSGFPSVAEAVGLPSL